jgi:hypothetical protein
LFHEGLCEWVKVDEPTVDIRIRPTNVRSYYITCQ